MGYWAVPFKDENDQRAQAPAAKNYGGSQHWPVRYDCWDANACNIRRANGCVCQYCGQPIKPLLAWGTMPDSSWVIAQCAGCKVRQSGEPTIPPWAFRRHQTAPAASSAPTQDNGFCNRPHLDDQETFEERSAILQERAQQAMALFNKQGHEASNMYLCLNPYSNEPLRVRCLACDGILTIQQRRHLGAGEEPFKGPVTFFDCKRLQRR